jgi:hypothetical protein
MTCPGITLQLDVIADPYNDVCVRVAGEIRIS